MMSELHKTLDLRGRRCPFTLMALSAAMRALPDGGVLEVLLDGPDGVEEISAWCDATGREFVEPEEDGTNRVYVRKGRRG